MSRPGRLARTLNERPYAGMHTPLSSEGATQLRVDAPLPQAGTPPQGSPRPQAKPRDGSPTSVLRCASASSAASSDADASPGRAAGGAPALPGAAGPHNAGQAAVAFQRGSCRVARCAPGFRLRLEDVPAPRRNSALEEALAVGSLLFLFGCASRPARPPSAFPHRTLRHCCSELVAWKQGSIMSMKPSV